MSDEKKPSVLRATDDPARLQAREMIVTARFAALAVIDPDTGYPNSSRVLIATDGASRPVILASRLASHTKALLASSRASLLLGEPGKGDPLAWPRISLQCDAVPVDPEDPERPHLRTRFLRRHPKAALYIDFPDFLFFRLRPLAASLNGGFGRAFALGPDDFNLPDGHSPLSSSQEDDIAAEIESQGTAGCPGRLAALEPGYAVFEAKGEMRLVRIAK